MHEWSYEQGADYYLLRYLHEAWDNESTGFAIECHPTDKTALTIGYTVMDDNYFKAYKRKQLKPKLAIQSLQERLSTVGELDENGLFSGFEFTIPQSSSSEFLKILSSANAVQLALKRGRDGRYRPPPAQNRAGGIPAHGSHLGCVTAKR